MKVRTATRRGRRRAVFCVGIGLVSALAALVLSQGARDSRDDAPAAILISQARAALKRGDYGLAEKLASAVAPDDRAWISGRLIAGEAAMRAERFDAAYAYFEATPRDGSHEAVLAALSSGEVARQLCRLTEAEQAYSYVLRYQPNHAAAHERLAFLLGVTGQRWESLPHFLFLIRDGEWTLNALVLLGDLERPMEEEEYLRRCAETAPDDVLVQSALAADALRDGRPSEAQRLLRRVVTRKPSLVGAQAMLGELLVDGEDRNFSAWHAGLPPTADRHADIWYVRGLWARRQGELRVAARCFWECVRLAPAHRRGNYQLGQMLVSLNEPSGRDFSERAGLLYELTGTLEAVLRSDGRDEIALKRVTELLEVTGRVWEAYAWATTADRFFPAADWPEAALDRVTPFLARAAIQTLDSHNLALRHDFSGLPGHESLLAESGRGAIRASAAATSLIRFEEEGDVGIDFVYDNGDDPSTKGVRMFEQTGGGIASFDFDGDGWPDLYFTQGARWRHGETRPSASPEAADRLFRNMGGAFADVTRRVGLGDFDFGQGCAVGDIDADGFLDLYVANVGLNRLYRNNGDGTFAGMNERGAVGEEAWTASCVVVDLNADGLPDLFDATYVTGPDVYEAICNGRACSPKAFDGSPDRVHVNRGDGTFSLAPVTAPSSNSKGLGVLAFDMQDRGRPCLLVANDQVPNYFLRNLSSDDQFGLRLTEDGFVTGLAFNRDGLPMASMGIAADDADGDGRLDFFVTTYKDESSTLYLQDANGLFVDATPSAGLVAPTLPYVGWGTQFLDADLDGEPDLVVANGHVDDYRDEGGEYHMRPQFFRNTGGGRFVESVSEEAGAYFGRKYLGRGLTKLDWNRDGLTDFVVSNIGDRASLVANRTTGAGHFLNVRLHATATARDAIGAIVEVVTDDRRWTKQLTAGDGYMASNERQLQFGIGEAESVREVRVNWPSGSVTVLKDLPPDVTVELIEGKPRGTLWRGTVPTSLAVPR